MYVLIKHKPLAWQFYKRLRRSRRYSLQDAEAVIRDNEEYCKQHHLKTELDVGIYEEGTDELLYRDEIELGRDHEYVRNLVTIVQNTFQNVLTNASEDDTRRFMARVQAEFDGEKHPQPVPDTQTPSQSRVQQMPAIPNSKPVNDVPATLSTENQALNQQEAPATERPVDQEEPAVAVSRPSSEAPVAPERGPKPIPTSSADPKPVPVKQTAAQAQAAPISQAARQASRETAAEKPVPQTAVESESNAVPYIVDSRVKSRSRERRKWSVSRRTLITVVVGLIVALAVGLGGYRLFYSAQAAPPPTYQQLIKAEKYVQAGKDYPDKRSEIEALLVNDGEDEALAQYTRKFPSANGKFDVAYAQKRYAAVVKASQSASMTKVRKSKLAVAYLKTKQYDQAAVLNKDLNDPDLEGLIALGYIQTGQFDQAKAINQQLKNKTIDQAIKTGETYQAAVKHYQGIANDKTKSAAERSQAKTSAASFQHQLETLGE